MPARSLAQELEATRASLSAAAARAGELLARVGSLESGARSDSLALADRKAEADRLRQQVAALEAAASSSAKAAAERIATAEAAVAAQAANVGDLREQLAALQRTAGESAHAAVLRLAAAEGAAAKQRQDAEILKQEVADLNELLAAAESKVDEQQDQIDGLDEQLAQALAKKVEELEQYRSEFFGQLRQALGDRPDLRVVGDRFVFQSELCSPRARPAWTRPGRRSCASSPEPCRTWRRASRPGSTGCCGSTATPTGSRSATRRSAPTGSCRRRARSR